MNQQSAASLGGMMNSFKWAIALTLIALGIFGNYHFADQSLTVRVAGLSLAAALAIVIALQTDKGKRLWRFSLDARNELRKVVWPSRQETMQTTVMVLSVVAIISLILWGVDVVLLRAIAWLTGYGAS